MISFSLYFLKTIYQPAMSSVFQYSGSLLFREKQTRIKILTYITLHSTKILLLFLGGKKGMF